MDPQNTDPNTTTPSSPQPDLGATLTPTTDPTPTVTPDPIPTSAPVDLPPVAPMPEPAIPEPTPTPTTDSAYNPGIGSTPTPEPVIPEPVAVPEPTTMPEQTPSLEPTPTAATPIDNPLTMPTEAPAVGGAEGFNWSGAVAPTSSPGLPETPLDNSMPQSVESAPTDLSQLTSANLGSQTPYTPPVSQPETLVVPPAPEATTIQADSGHSVPKWAIIAGGVTLLLLVVSASAYFILGIGKTATDTQSLPATEQTTLITPPAASPITETPSTATSSAGFSAVSPSQAPAATSAAELLKQRQQAK